MPDLLSRSHAPRGNAVPARRATKHSPQRGWAGFPRSAWEPGRKFGLFILGNRLIFAAAALNLSACSYIQNWFPDKEKDYQFATEIPPMAVPGNLKDGNLAKALEEPPLMKIKRAKPVATPEQVAQDAEPVEKAPETGEAAAAETAAMQQAEQTAQSEPTTEAGQPEQSEQPAQTEQAVPAPEQNEAPAVEPPAEQNEAPAAEPPAEQTETPNEDPAAPTPVELVHYTDGERRLRIAKEPEFAWHLVSKALSRNAIEVTERDQEQKLFHVLYNPEVKKAEDGSLLDEAIFFLKGVETNEKRYLLKLVAVDGNSDLAVMDEDLNPVVNDAVAVKLLKLLGGTIQGK